LTSIEEQKQLPTSIFADLVTDGDDHLLDFDFEDQQTDLEVEFPDEATEASSECELEEAHSQPESDSIAAECTTTKPGKMSEKEAVTKLKEMERAITKRINRNKSQPGDSSRLQRCNVVRLYLQQLLRFERPSKMEVSKLVSDFVYGGSQYQVPLICAIFKTISIATATPNRPRIFANGLLTSKRLATVTHTHTHTHTHTRTHTHTHKNTHL
jgi:hypothetical protein